MAAHRDDDDPMAPLTLTAAPTLRRSPTDAAAVTVVIADDHPLFRRGVARAIKRAPALELVGEASDGREALALIAALEPDVAVLDHRMPQLSGVEVCAQLRLHPHLPKTAVLLLSAYEDPAIAAAAYAAGASACLGKTASHGEVCAAIERIGRERREFAEP